MTITLVIPPLVTLATFFTGLAVGWIRTDFYQLRFLVQILMMGPIAIALGSLATTILSHYLLGASWNLSQDNSAPRRLWVTVVVHIANLVAIFLVLSQAIQRWGGWGS
ncbi:hypothetical protein [Paludisphaera mucosa]|uniref:Uncharacterized protein n=1 Tax=Paludisphaera mucosa TaxID=3030827 RepID=A0ABT6FKK2_9BACT|nr:hypothetical protein [Paludisphaera mucosa]MDG3008103.1 hypothetical protein [Paludisphaera mucosa]